MRCMLCGSIEVYYTHHVCMILSNSGFSVDHLCSQRMDTPDVCWSRHTSIVGLCLVYAASDKRYQHIHGLQSHAHLDATHFPNAVHGELRSAHIQCSAANATCKNGPNS